MSMNAILLPHFVTSTRNARTVKDLITALANPDFLAMGKTAKK